MTNKAVCVLGMHRSGTSAITGALQLLGVYLGEDLYKPHPGVNDKGYWEHSDIVDLHDRLLLALGSSWDDILTLPEGWQRDPAIESYREKLRYYVKRDFKDRPVWGMKDPRLCRLLPLWREIFHDVGDEPIFLLMVRNPLEVAHSLRRRDGFTKEKSLFLWLQHTLQAEYESRFYKRAFINYDQLLQSPEDALARVEQTLSLSWPTPLESAAPLLRNFLTSQLRHHKQTEAPQETRLEKIVYEAYAYFRRVVEGVDPEIFATFDYLRNQRDNYIRDFDPVLLSHLTLVAKQRAQLQLQLNQIHSSLLWRLTKPIRFIQRSIKSSAHF